MDEMDKKRAYEIVLEDLKIDNDTLFRGFYDPKSGGKSFMHGILHVLIWLSNHVSEEETTKLENEFFSAMTYCENEALEKEVEDG